jgi:dynein heavy chain
VYGCSFISILNCFPYFQVLKYTAGQINYGGRVTDDWDRRCIMTVLTDYYQPDVLEPGHKFSEAGVYHQLKGETPHEVMR